MEKTFDEFLKGELKIMDDAEKESGPDDEPSIEESVLSILSKSEHTDRLEIEYESRKETDCTSSHDKEHYGIDKLGASTPVDSEEYEDEDAPMVDVPEMDEREFLEYLEKKYNRPGRAKHLMRLSNKSAACQCWEAIKKSASQNARYCIPFDGDLCFDVWILLIIALVRLFRQSLWI